MESTAWVAAMPVEWGSPVIQWTGRVPRVRRAKPEACVTKVTNKIQKSVHAVVFKHLNPNTESLGSHSSISSITDCVDFQTVKTITMVPVALRSAVPIVQALATKSTEPAPLVRRATKECTASQKQNQTVCIQYMYMYQE